MCIYSELVPLAPPPQPTTRHDACDAGPGICSATCQMTAAGDLFCRCGPGLLLESSTDHEVKPTQQTRQKYSRRFAKTCCDYRSLK